MKKTLATLGLAGAIAAAPVQQAYEHIVMHPRVQSAAGYLYHNSPNEWLLCLGGHQSADTLYVDRAEMPIIKAASPDSVAFSDCDNDNYIGTMHPHHNNNPNPSARDVETWQNNGGLAHLIVTDDEVHVWRVRGS